MDNYYLVYLKSGKQYPF